METLFVVGVQVVAPVDDAVRHVGRVGLVVLEFTAEVERWFVVGSSHVGWFTARLGGESRTVNRFSTVDSRRLSLYTSIGTVLLLRRR